MEIRRIIPDLHVADMERARTFYRTLGLEEVMDLGWAVTLASPTNPSAQVMLIGANADDPKPDISIEVADVDAVHDTLVDTGADIIYSLRDEPWGVRRFFVLDPAGKIVNILTHR